MINGPMMVEYHIYDDFSYYSSGIYRAISGYTEYRHTVMLMGWGLDGSNNLYWLCKNSWGTWWGESGFFRIYADTPALDSAAFACTPDI